MKILKETTDWLVIDKPSGLHSVHQKDCRGCIEEWLRKERLECASLKEAGLVHRLDELTSGCLLAAKNQNAYEKLKSEMQSSKGGLKKIYHALASGTPKQTSFKLYFTSRYKGSKKITVTDKGSSQDRGECRWKILKKLGNFSLLEVELIGPGKRHQIRAGLAVLGHPLRGDVLYGGTEWKEGFGLHAYSLTIDGERAVAPANWEVD